MNRDAITGTALIKQWLVVPVTGVLCFAIGWAMREPPASDNPPSRPPEIVRTQVEELSTTSGVDAGFPQRPFPSAPPTLPMPLAVEETAEEEEVAEPLPQSSSEVLAAAAMEPRFEPFARAAESVAESTLRSRLQATGSDLVSFRCGSRTCVGEVRNAGSSTSVVRDWMMQACVGQCRFGLSGDDGQPSHTIWMEFREGLQNPNFDEVTHEQSSALERINPPRTPEGASP